MKIAYIGDCKGKVHGIRINAIRKILTDVSFDICIPPKMPKVKKYDVIYYAFHGLYNKFPVSHPNMVTSITSHKCLLNFKNTLKNLKKFKRVSVNNKILYNKFSEFMDVLYIPNGVDSKIFYDSKRVFDPNNIVFGWVGNTDRATKNYHSIIKPLKKIFRFKTIETKKSKKYKIAHKDIVKFYHSIDFYVVSSTTEGTPNPALEAASCGVPLISTKVGNMLEIIEDRKNGYLIDSPTLEDAKIVLSSVFSLSKKDYDKMSSNIKHRIRMYWQWSDRYADFCLLFGKQNKIND